MASIVVALESPFNVLRTDSRLQEFLGFAPEDVYGRSIRFLQGPMTDSTALHSAIKSASFYKATSVHLVLYGWSGQCSNVIVSCSPFHDSSDALIGCLINLERSDAITIKDALELNSGAQALVSSDNSQMIHVVSDGFADTYGFTQSEMMGRTLRTILGPRTDYFKWNAMLHTASSGRACSESLYTCSSSGMEFMTTVSCIPVMEPLTSKIGSYLIRFSAHPQFMNTSTSSFQGHHACSHQEGSDSAISMQYSATQNIFPPFVPTQADHHQSRSDFTFDTSARPSIMSSSSSAPPPPTITRRRKAGDPSDGGASPIAITLDLLEGMAEMTLIAAAKKIRVSTTALKKACRKLGVERWPYRRETPGGPPPPPRDFDEAYVRKLHRKYGGPTRCPAGPAPAASFPAAQQESCALSALSCTPSSCEDCDDASVATPPAHARCDEVDAWAAPAGGCQPLDMWGGVGLSAAADHGGWFGGAAVGQWAPAGDFDFGMP